MFHSIYGTERFQGFTLPLERRPEVRNLIGERAERLAYLNCAMDRADVRSRPRSAGQALPDRRPGHRPGGRTLPANSTTCAGSTCTIGWSRCPRSPEWDYRRAAYRKMAERLGLEAVEDYERIFAREEAEAAR